MRPLKNQLLVGQHSVLSGKMLRASNKETCLFISASQPQIPFKKMRESREKRKENVLKLKHG